LTLQEFFRIFGKFAKNKFLGLGPQNFN
jgi:hypothetical protein